MGTRLIHWLFGRFFPARVERVYIVLPDHSANVDDKDYFTACERIAATPEGKTLVKVLRANLYEALNRRCPKGTAAERSEWLAAHDVLVATRRTFLRHFTEPQEFLRQTPSRKAIPAMGSRIEE